MVVKIEGVIKINGLGDDFPLGINILFGDRKRALHYREILYLISSSKLHLRENFKVVTMVTVSELPMKLILTNSRDTLNV